MEEATAPLVSSPHCSVAIETRGWRCMFFFFCCCFQKQTGRNDGRKKERREEKERKADKKPVLFTVFPK